MAIIQTASTSGLPPSEVTFAEVLKEAGYKTALIGTVYMNLDFFIFFSSYFIIFCQSKTRTIPDET